jgi:hypothetical protein
MAWSSMKTRLFRGTRNLGLCPEDEDAAVMLSVDLPTR